MKQPRKMLHRLATDRVTTQHLSESELVADGCDKLGQWSYSVNLRKRSSIALQSLYTARKETDFPNLYVSFFSITDFPWEIKCNGLLWMIPSNNDWISLFGPTFQTVGSMYEHNKLRSSDRNCLEKCVNRTLRSRNSICFTPSLKKRS